jgi:hypothetical protein
MDTSLETQEISLIELQTTLTNRFHKKSVFPAWLHCIDAVGPKSYGDGNGTSQLLLPRATLRSIFGVLNIL